MPKIPTLIARLFDDTDADARRVNREIDAIRTDSRTIPAGGRTERAHEHH